MINAKKGVKPHTKNIIQILKKKVFLIDFKFVYINILFIFYHLLSSNCLNLFSSNCYLCLRIYLNI